MEKIGIKFDKKLDYERFEPLQYWLNHEFEYEDLDEYLEEGKVIELELEEDEDRREDIEMLEAFLEKFDNDKIVYELFTMNDEWERKELHTIV